MSDAHSYTAREIAEKIAKDATMRLVCMKPEYDTIDMGERLILLYLERQLKRFIEVFCYE